MQWNETEAMATDQVDGWGKPASESNKTDGMMSSEGWGKDVVGDSQRCSGCKGPQFFKVLLESSWDELRIPKAFAHHIKRHSSYATLDSPAVKKWPVTLTADGDGLLFKNGWREFFEHHDLAVGDFLLFTYNGNMHFTVRIFGRSCCEYIYVFCVDDEGATETLRRPVCPLTSKPEDSEDDICVVTRRPLGVSSKIVKKPDLKPAGECTVFLPGIKGNPSFQYVLKRGGNYL